MNNSHNVLTFLIFFLGLQYSGISNNLHAFPGDHEGYTCKYFKSVDCEINDEGIVLNPADDINQSCATKVHAGATPPLPVSVIQLVKSYHEQLRTTTIDILDTRE